jgi:mitofilin
MDELNSLLIHAHKRVMQLQKQLENTQLTQNKQIQSALEEQRHQSAEAAKSLEASVYELHRKEFLLEQEKTVFAFYQFLFRIYWIYF